MERHILCILKGDKIGVKGRKTGKIESEMELDKLNAWIKFAVESNSVQDFEKNM